MRNRDKKFLDEDLEEEGAIFEEDLMLMNTLYKVTFNNLHFYSILLLNSVYEFQKN